MPTNTSGFPTSGASSSPQTMRSLVTSLLLSLVLFLAASDGLRMINLDAPDSALQGDTIHLSCFFNLQKPQQPTTYLSQPNPASEKFKSRLNDSNIQPTEDSKVASGILIAEQLYAVKWYKNEREFFRYLAQDWPRKQALPADGLLVDIDKSDNFTVVLRNVSLKTSGQFKCEVSTDAPYFVTKSIERKLLIYALPNEGPLIEVLKPMQGNQPKGRYFLNQQIELKCSTAESKPAASLDWIINDSLNLSSPTIQHNQQLEQLFQIKNQKLVRISQHFFNGATPNANFNRQATGRSPPEVSSRHQMASSTATYELIGDNATFIGPHSQSLTGPTVLNLASSTLNQLLEMSTSRLNFTLDANLLQLLLSLDGGSTYQAKTRQANRKNSPLSRESTIDNQFVSLNPANLKQMTKTRSEDAIRRGTRSNLPISSTSIFDLKPDLPPLLQALEGPQSLARAPGGQFISGKKKQKLRHNDNNAKPVLLKISCVARLLQLTMSHHIKMTIANKTKDSEEDSTIMNALMQKTSDKNSGEARVAFNYQRFILSLVVLQLMLCFF